VFCTLHNNLRGLSLSPPYSPTHLLLLPDFEKALFVLHVRSRRYTFRGINFLKGSIELKRLVTIALVRGMKGRA